MDFTDPFHNIEENIEDSLGEVKVKNKTSEAFISNQSEKSNQFTNESNVTF